MAKHNEALLQAKHKYLAEKRKEENVVCAMYDSIASSLDNQRRFWDSWAREVISAHHM